jgi:hypothetical protein
MKKMLFAAAMLATFATPGLAQTMAPTTGTGSYATYAAGKSANSAYAQAPRITQLPTISNTQKQQPTRRR